MNPSMPRWMVPAEERELFLEHIRAGSNRPDAARKVNPSYTGHMFRTLANSDPYFRDAYEEACVAGRENRIDLIRQAMWERKDESERILLELANQELPERAYVRKQRVEHANADGTPFEVKSLDAVDVEISRLLAELGSAGEASPAEPTATGEVADSSQNGGGR